MGLIGRTIMGISLNNIKEVDKRFSKNTRMNMKSIPEKFKAEVLATRDLCFREIKPTCVFQSLAIKHMTVDEIYQPSAVKRIRLLSCGIVGSGII